MDVGHGGWPDRSIGALAARQRTLVTRRQLLDLGVSASAITRARRRGRLHPVHRGVYSLVAPAARPPLAGEQAALLACGPDALLSHETAAALHGLRVRTPAAVHITLNGGDRRRRGIAIHRSRRLEREERARVAGLPVTSIARTVVDLAADRSDRALEHLVDEAIARTGRARVRRAAARHRARPGVRRIARLLDPDRPSSDTWSAAEERLLRLIRRSGLPAPEVNVPVGVDIPDLMWRAERVLVEYDSIEFHSDRRAFEHDRERHNRLASDGWQVMHVTWAALDRRPERVLVWIAAALARGHPGVRR